MDDFLVVARSANVTAAPIDDAFDHAARAMGDGVTLTRSGRTSLAIRGAATHGTRGTHLRVAHGGAMRTVTRTGSFDDWVGASGGGFAALEIATDTGDVKMARDRFGAVPVYYVTLPGCTVVSSRLAWIMPFLHARAFDGHALGECIRFRWISGRRSLASGVSLVGAGETQEISSSGGTGSTRAWGALEFRGDGAADTRTQVDALRAALGAAIAESLAHSRRPGILLSGGVDSSVIAALARQQRDDLRCFIAVLPGDGIEELRRARFVAQKLGLPLEEISFDTSRLDDDLHRVIELLEEPPRNPNNLVLVQLYEAMAQHGIDVALNGDGPEMLLGLSDSKRVAKFAAKHRRVAAIPGAIRALAARCLRDAGGPRAWRLARVLGDTPLDFAQALDEIEYPLPIRRRLRNWPSSTDPRAAFPHASDLAKARDPAEFDDALHAYQCATTLLSTQRRHECIARSSGIEASSPFVHARTVQYAEQLPRALRYTTRSRPMLKQLCDELVHPDVASWEKLGFSVPWEQWLDGPLARVLGEPAAYADLEHVLPPGFIREAFRTRSPEALWTLLGTRMVGRALGLEGVSDA